MVCELGLNKTITKNSISNSSSYWNFRFSEGTHNLYLQLKQAYE